VKEKTWKEKETESLRGKRRYLERLEQTREANKEIEDFDFDTSPVEEDMPRNTNK